MRARLRTLVLCARTGIEPPDQASEIIGTSPPATISAALRYARNFVFTKRPETPTWGAYQHYGRISDKLLPLPNLRRASGIEPADAANRPNSQTPTPRGATNPKSPISIATLMTTDTKSTAAAQTGTDPNLVYVNGIDPETGSYAVPPRAIEEIAKVIRRSPSVSSVRGLHGEQPRSFGLPLESISTYSRKLAGASSSTRTPLRTFARRFLPLVTVRRNRAKNRFKELDYKKGEQTKEWYQRHGISTGTMAIETVPYYLLLVGGTNLIPFEFQYLLGIEYAVGRLVFDTAPEYERYARSIVAYEAATSVPNAKEIVYWGTHHLGDPATELSSSQLIGPLANGIAGAAAERSNNRSALRFNVVRSFWPETMLQKQRYWNSFMPTSHRRCCLRPHTALQSRPVGQISTQIKALCCARTGRVSAVSIPSICSLLPTSPTTPT